MVSTSARPQEILWKYLGSSLARVFGWVAFWLAIMLPIPLCFLMVLGITTPTTLIAFLGTLVVNVAALVAGHRHAKQ